MDEAERIDKLIHLMFELKELAKNLEDPRNDVDVTLATIIACKSVVILQNAVR